METLKGKTIEEKLNWYRGEIIPSVIEIEKALSWHLRLYFFPKSNVQASVFYNIVLNANYFSFNRKIELYKQVPHFKKLKNYAKVVNSLSFVQKLRNELAHWELLNIKSSDSNEITIYNPITFAKRKLNKNLIKEFISHDQYLLKKFGWRYTLEEKYGIKNKNILSGRNAEIREFARLLHNSKHIS